MSYGGLLLAGRNGRLGQNVVNEAYDLQSAVSVLIEKYKNTYGAKIEVTAGFLARFQGCSIQLGGAVAAMNVNSIADAKNCFGRLKDDIILAIGQLPPIPEPQEPEAFPWKTVAIAGGSVIAGGFVLWLLFGR